MSDLFENHVGFPMCQLKCENKQQLLTGIIIPDMIMINCRWRDSCFPKDGHLVILCSDSFLGEHTGLVVRGSDS